jgi:exosortase A-associated hydrolase 1
MTGLLPRERALTFACGEATLVGIVHATPGAARRGVLIVVGGPQYRAGSHRQFLLLARSLARGGIPAMRFDHRGIGDSDDPYLGFEALGDDIAAAVDVFLAEYPGIEEVVLWGLCDAASAILFYAHRDPRVAGIVLANPWVRTPQGEARAYLRHYYLRRLRERDFWRGMVAGRVNPAAATRSLTQLMRQLRGGPAATACAPLPDRMAEGLERFRGPVLLILSGQDLTAREFEDAIARSADWRRLLDHRRVTRAGLAAADHTFSRRQWRDRVASLTLDWLRSW